jgi:hypothetical protein
VKRVHKESRVGDSDQEHKTTQKELLEVTLLASENESAFCCVHKTGCWFLLQSVLQNFAIELARKLPPLYEETTFVGIFLCTTVLKFVYYIWIT